MNLTDSLKLLRDYAERSDEAAFRELVERYIDMVYSAAVRRVGGDADLARDVTQTVFTDLARKARSLRNVERLGGWLHRHTGYVAATVVRSERRRQIREQEAAQMNALNDSPDALWQQLAPILDETIESLEPSDRQAILLRFFERRDFRSMGTALGISDDAAQKRVSRALEKLRERLSQRGVTASLVFLGTLMAGKVIKAAPSGLAADIARLALMSASGGGGLALALAKLTNSLLFKLALGGVVIAVVAWLILPSHTSPDHPMAPRQGVAVVPANGSAQTTPHSEPRLTPIAPTSEVEQENASSNTLLLNIVTKASGKPVPNVKLDYWLWIDGKLSQEKPLQADTSGVCEVPVPKAITELTLVSEHDGFADTRLDWRPDRGEEIPMEYTLRLAPAVAIGGKVVGPDGKPVAGAEVCFNNQPDPAVETRPQSDDFGWPFKIVTTTDAQGRWQIVRIGKEAIWNIYGSASHPNYLGTALVFPGHDPEVQKQLLAGTQVFALGSAVTVRGMVENSYGQPVPAARVFVGHTGGSRQTTCQPDGIFSIAGCKPGKSRITVQSEDYAPVTMPVDLMSNSAPFRIILESGRRLELQVVDANGNAVPGARVWLNFNAISFYRQTDVNGRLEWDNAPKEGLTVAVTGAGYMGTGKLWIRPDGTEHVITLRPGLTISGTVRDGTTGQPISRFRIVTGCPFWNRINNTTNYQWNRLDRFCLNFDGGKFRHQYMESVAGGTNPTFIFKFEADGYAPYVTRPVKASEREVHLDVKLTPASPTEVTVLFPDGSVAARTDIALVSADTHLFLVPGGFLHDYSQSGVRMLMTDDRGHFQLPYDPAIIRIVAAGPRGYLETTSAELLDNPVMRLQPWGRLEGSYLKSGQPVTDAELRFQYDEPHKGSILCDFSTFQTKTDNEGRFVFDQVPPGTHELTLLIPGHDANGKFWTEKPLQKVAIRSGETTTIRLGNSR